VRYTHIPVTAFDRLSGIGLEAKAVYLTLLAGPHRTSAPGLFRSGAASLAETCEATPEAFAACVAVLESRGLVVTDFSQRVVFLPHAGEDDPPANRNVVRAWRKVLDEIPAGELKARAVEVLRRAAGPFATDAKNGADLLEGAPCGNGMPDGIGNGIGNGMPTQTQTPTPTPTQTQIQSPTPTENTRNFSSSEGSPSKSPRTNPHGVTMRKDGGAACYRGTWYSPHPDGKRWLAEGDYRPDGTSTMSRAKDDVLNASVWAAMSELAKRSAAA
jgi:hypothetical protein